MIESINENRITIALIFLVLAIAFAYLHAWSQNQKLVSTSKKAFVQRLSFSAMGLASFPLVITSVYLFITPSITPKAFIIFINIAIALTIILEIGRASKATPKN